MSEHKRKRNISENNPKGSEVQKEYEDVTQGDAKIIAERYRNAHPGFFLRAATWILSRFPLTQNKYQNWSPTKRIIIGWLCWLILTPIIPIAAIILWYAKDPEGFKRSPWAKALIGVAVLWAGYFGVVITNPSQADVNGRYSPVQTKPNGETAGKITDSNTASQTAKEKISSQKTSRETNGRVFKNCTEAFEAGVFNIKRSDPSYEPRLDRDSDGIACEK